MPFMAAARENGSSTPVQYNSWVKATDEKGDANALGKFHSNTLNKHLFVFTGNVTAVSASSVTVKRTSSSGVVTTYTYTVDTTTAVIRKFKGTASIADVTVGDKVQVWSTLRTGGIAKLIWDKSIWRVDLKGTVSALDTTAMTFTLTVTRKEPETGLQMTLAIPIKTTATTAYWDGITPITFGDLTNGEVVKLVGTFDTIGKYVTATKVRTAAI